MAGCVCRAGESGQGWSRHDVGADSRRGLLWTAAAPAGVKGVAGQGDPEVVAALQPGGLLSRTAAGDTGITYQVYVPGGFKAEAPPPVIIAFSPGGSGRQMVNAMKESAEKVGWLLVGCDKLKNSMPDERLERKMEDEVLADIFSKLPYQPKRIYFAGFSGGAMRSYELSARRKEKFAGIIAYGGWLGGRDNQRKPFCSGMAVALMNGEKDGAANSWAGSDTEVLKRRKCRVKPFSFPGGHGIAPAAVTDQAIAWLEEDWKKYGSKR